MSCKKEIILSDVFSNGMILQRDQNCVFHGVGELAEDVNVQLLDQNGTVIDDSFLVNYIIEDGADTGSDDGAESCADVCEKIDATKCSNACCDNSFCNDECDTISKYGLIPGTDEPADGNINIFQNLEKHWEITVKPHPAGGPFSIKIINGSDADAQEIVISDVLYGDVWVAGGQSNMDFRMMSDKFFEESNRILDDDQVRVFTVPRENRYKPTDRSKSKNSSRWDAPHTTGSWKCIKPGEIGDLTAVGVYFGMKLHADDPSVPIGIVDCSWGGTSITAWMDKEHLAMEPGAKLYMDDYYKYLDEHPADTYDKMEADYFEEVKAWQARYDEATQKGLSNDKANEFAGPYPWMHPFAPMSEFAPTRLFGTMFMTMAPLKCTGAIYYQGETDVAHYDLYEHLTELMIANWKDALQVEKLPFYLVQLATYRGDSGEARDWAYLRDAQLSIMKHLPDTGMAVISDHGDEVDIHPTNKRPVGERLALFAEKFVYGKDIVYSGPIYSGYEVCENAIKVNFESVGGGLVINDCEENDQKCKIMYEIAGDDGVYVTADVTIDGDSIVFSSDKVPAPKHVRYGWYNYFCPTIFNKEGLPASAFSTEVTKL